MPYTDHEIHELKKIAVNLRANLIEMIPAGKVGHLGGSSSMSVIKNSFTKLFSLFGSYGGHKNERVI